MAYTDYNFTGTQLRDAGIRLATEHADAAEVKWSERAYNFLITDFLPKHKRFMTEELRLYASQKAFPLPPHARAWGGIIVKAAHQYLIIKTGIRTVKNPKAHCANATLWERNDERLLGL